MSNLKKVFKQKNTEIPIWLMRQAGRYLPEYMEIRKNKNNFLDLCFNSKLATKITLQPITRFNLDAAIIFSDILVILDALGWNVTFQKNRGPVLDIFQSDQDLLKLSDKFDKKINNIYDTTSNVKSSLKNNVSLIGFAGSPWTVISYMLEGERKKDFSSSRRFLHCHYSTAKKLFKIISEKTVEYLLNQIKAGAEVIQLFDSWSGMLTNSLYKEFVIKPTKYIVENIKIKHPSVPIIGFPRGSGYNYDSYIANTSIDGVSVDQFIPCLKMQGWKKNIVVQGNLDPVVLLANRDTIKREADIILHAMDKKNFIFNLGHGIMPNTDPNNVEFLVNYVKEFKK